MLNDLLKRLVMGFDKFKVPYMIVGGQAAILYREPRYTNDIDITIGIGSEEKSIIYQICDALKLEPLTKDPDSFIDETMVLPVLDPISTIRIDFIFSQTGYEATAISRARIVTVDDCNIRYCSLEDMIILKIFAGRPRDLQDAESIIRLNQGYDHGLVELSLKSLGESVDVDFIDILNQVRKSALSAED